MYDFVRNLKEEAEQYFTKEENVGWLVNYSLGKSIS
jgi:hypothetical protein